MSSDREQLLAMGFESSRVEWALKATQNRGLQPAMDHLIEHEGQPVPDLSTSSATSAPTSSGNQDQAMDIDDEDTEALKAVYGKANIATSSEVADAEAKSIKCSQCGKIFKNTALANFHAEKSGHDQFEESTEEIKPLTEEEKKRKFEELKEKMAEKRARKAAEDTKEAKANEAIRRKGGKEIGQLKEEIKAKEAIKAAEQARKDKIEDAKAKAAIKAQIEADKKARAEKAAREKAFREGAISVPEAASSSASSTAPRAPAAGKDYKETRLQIRLASGGQPYTTTLSSDATLREVAEYLAGQTLSVDVDTVTLAQHFPRKQFSPSDFSKTLKELGLTPSAVLIAS